MYFQHAACCNGVYKIMPVNLPSSHWCKLPVSLSLYLCVFWKVLKNAVANSFSPLLFQEMGIIIFALASHNDLLKFSLLQFTSMFQPGNVKKGNKVQNHSVETGVRCCSERLLYQEMLFFVHLFRVPPKQQLTPNFVCVMGSHYHLDTWTSNKLAVV